MLDIFYHGNSLLHSMGHGHLESPDRIKIIEQALRQAPFKKNFHQAQTVNPNDILRVHDRSLHTLVKASQARGRHMFTPDTIANQYTYQAALTAAGGSIQTGLNAKVRPSFAMVRPPGHHATHSTVMGFCFYNNIAITAGYLRQHNYKRIAIIDVDNHHGNGTQDIFAPSADILYTSLHADPSITFPGTGYATEVGLGEGEGTTVNIPLPGGTGDDDYLFAFDTIISPVVKQFKPEIILVSYGVDGLIGDPYGSLGLSVDGFRAIGTRIGMLGKLLCDHRIGVFLEGGYNYDMMGEATVNFFSGLLFPENYEKTMLSPGNEIQRVVFNVRSIHRNYWYGL